MIRHLARTLFLIVLALAFHSSLTAEALLSEDASAITIPLEIEINGSSQGEVIVRSDASLQIVEIEGIRLKELLRNKVTPDLISFVESLPEGFHTLETYQELGLEIQLDLERLVITLQIQQKAAYLDDGPKSIQLGYQRNPNYEAHTKQATFSGFANFRLRSTIDSNDDTPSVTKHQLSIAHAVNLAGYALEGESLWNEDKGLSLREFRLVKDFPKHLWRATAGDVSTPINELQRGFQIFGLNLAKEFGIQPYRTFTPTSSASFELTEESTVKVNINGNHVRTLNLDPGIYNIEEFKLLAGPNKMDLQISSASGLFDELTISEFGAPNQLDAGVSTYSFSYGFPRSSESAPDSKPINASAWYQRFVESEPIFSSYYKRGITNQLTATFDAQGSSEWLRIGVSAHTASELFGALSAGISHNQTSTHSGALSSKLIWTKNIKDYQLSFTHLYTGSGFNLLKSGQTPRDNEIKTSSSLSISKLFREKLSVSTNILHQTKHDGSKSTTINLRLGRRFAKVYAALSLRHLSSTQRSDTSAFLTCTWNPAKQWRARSQAGFASQKGGTGISTNLDYSNRRPNDYINARIDTNYTDAGYDLGGSFDYQTDLYSIGLSHNQVYGAIDDYITKGAHTSFTANSAIAFADGAFGFADRIRDSFALVSKHPAWSDVQLGINPSLGGFEKRNKSAILSPVLTTLVPYQETYATVQTVDSDLFLNRNDYYFFPGYKRGTNLKLGDDAIYALRGTLKYADGDLVAYKAVHFTDQSGETAETFTNKVGRFMATGLKPGPYRVTVAGTSETVSVIIEKGETMIFAGDLSLQE